MPVVDLSFDSDTETENSNSNSNSSAARDDFTPANWT